MAEAQITERIREALMRHSLAAAEHRVLLGRLLGLTESDVLAVQHLAREGTMTPSRLGARLHLTSGGTTALLQRLERAGHLERRPNPNDRRSVLVALSPSVRERAGAALAPYVAELDRLIELLTPQDRTTVERFLGAVAAAGGRHAEALASTALADAREGPPPDRTGTALEMVA
jgi:DNA-binding MarR family transcriptional regulator